MQPQDLELSMGMSGDFEQAVSATLVGDSCESSNWGGSNLVVGTQGAGLRHGARSQEMDNWSECLRA